MTFTKETAKTEVSRLKTGESMLTAVRAVINGKFQIEIADMIEREGAGSINILSVLNSEDPRFQNNGGARRAWATADKANLIEMFNISEDVLNSLEVGEEGKDTAYVCIKNPSHGTARLRVIVKETIMGDDYQNANVDKTAKRAGGPDENGVPAEFLTSEGSNIFSNTDVTTAFEGEKVPHNFIISDQEQNRSVETTQGVKRHP
jgi:hypothetical protein